MTLNSLDPLRLTSEHAQAAWCVLKEYLVFEKARCYQEIGAYPTPITGCDQQFNYLLERQRYLSQAMARLVEMEDDDQFVDNPQQKLARFIHVVADIDSEMGHNLQSMLVAQPYN